MSGQAERLEASETSPPEEQVSALETTRPDTLCAFCAVQRRVKRTREGQPLYPVGPFSTLSSNSSTRQVHPLDLEGLLDDLEGYVGRFPQARQYSPRTRVAWMREDIKRGLLGPRPGAVNVSSGEPVHGNGTLE